MGKVGKETGKSRNITRRDFVHGIGLGGAMLAFSAGMPAFTSEGLSPANYPPLRTGLRGSHPGSYEAAHDLVQEKLSIKPPRETDEQYDLVVVGAGVSGLAASHYYQKRFGAGSNILLLENHDDFGGHARRNEFDQGGDTRLAIGGAQYLAHWLFTPVVDELMRDLGVDIELLLAENEFRFGRNGREGPAIWFDEATFGTNRLVTGCDLAGNVGHSMLAQIDAFPIQGILRQAHQCIGRLESQGGQTLLDEYPLHYVSSGTRWFERRGDRIIPEQQPCILGREHRYFVHSGSAG